MMSRYAGSIFKTMGFLVLLGVLAPAGAERADIYTNKAYVDRHKLPEVASPLTGVHADGIHDSAAGSIDTLQNPREALRNFPKDKRQEVDWVKALDQGFIHPRKTRTGLPSDGAPMEVLDMDLLLKRTSDMPWVRFPHDVHTKWLACSNCHPDIFIKKLNGNPITMTKILKGEFCGRCHDKISFSLWTCERCHNTPQDESKGLWGNKK